MNYSETMNGPPTARLLGVALALLAATITSAAPQTAPPQEPPPPAASDAALDAASAIIGRAAILRGFYAGSELAFDATGHIHGSPKAVDWTLAAVDVQKLTRRPDGSIQMDGTRVAIRYNPDQHTFDRHPLKGAPIRIELAAPASESAVRAALANIFSIGIDPALQRSMPPLWRHYFLSTLDWGPDSLAGQTILPAAVKVPDQVDYPLLDKKSEPGYTAEAAQDKVKGTVQLRIVVDAEGIPRRIAVRQPLGYGLDERAAEAVGHWRFHPGTRDGKPAAFELLINQAFDVAPPARP